MNLGDPFPNWCLTEVGGKNVCLHDYLHNRWTIVLTMNASHPVSSSEMASLWRLQGEFSSRKVALLVIVAASTDSLKQWLKDVQVVSDCSGEFHSFPILADGYGQMHRHHGIGDACRDVPHCAYVLGGQNTLQLSLTYPPSTGRNFSELLRSVLALIVTTEQRVATPVDWNFQSPCLILPELTEEEVATEFPGGIARRQMPSGRDYMRYSVDSIKVPNGH
ncbi:glutathione peroxidase-like [Tropilaelaps mercedesae]|uniref:Glutathione peroxidase-like n=1 Tax=Tropilaelaps mercedesae TaxID=418985 RepID=A0A1V9X8T9_9ACAR|nr:glutathione peroxidase-like [Tropilaelaps mercedesae]